MSKIVFIISSLGNGGAERVLALIANFLSKQYIVYIVTFSSDDPFYELNSNIKHIKLGLLKPSKSIVDKIKNTIHRIKILRRTLREIDADINISFMTHTNIISIIASRLNSQRIIISEDTEYFFYNNKFLFFIRKIVYRFSNFLIVKTKADKKNYTFLRDVVVIGNPLPDTTFKNIYQKENIILAVGRLNKQKGFDNLIKAFSKISTKKWKLIIAGEGIERKLIEKLIKKYKLNNVQLIGRRKDIFEWYAKASIFVLSSRKEGFGNVLIEAMSCGCASVSFDCPYGPSEIIDDGINGILVENQNIDKLAYNIQKLINDKKLREKLGREAVKVKDKYNIEKIAREWEQIMLKVVSK